MFEWLQRVDLGPSMLNGRGCKLLVFSHFDVREGLPWLRGLNETGDAAGDAAPR
jgi:hypothetical protein